MSSLIGFVDRGSPLILVLGLRRSGKTSLLLTALSELTNPSIVLDLRELYARGKATALDLTRILEKGLNALLKGFTGFRGRLLELLKGVRGVEVAGLSLEFRRVLREPDLSELLTLLDEAAQGRGERVVLAFDEAQELRKVAGFRFDALLAHVYDHLRNLTVILTGSQVGLLYRFLRVGDPDAPLYGRAMSTVNLENLSREQSMEFLKRGFEQHGLPVGEKYIEEAVSKLDGSIGWLTLLGYRTVEAGSADRGMIEAVLEEASSLALEELTHFLNLRPTAKNRYENLLRAAATLGEAAWSSLKLALQAVEGRRINDRNFTAILKSLLESGFLTREDGKYRISDPILRHALRT
ncbi:ATP-binding protein [Candidatus Bathyarchaeota archaeon]|nr:ATP-binding protein [Candidatus Bathyarchaeota archaeon]